MANDYRPQDETSYRIEFQVQRRRPGEEDFTEIGFASSGGWGTPAEAAHMVSSAVDNYEWETQDGQPDPAEVKREVEESP